MRWHWEKREDTTISGDHLVKHFGILKSFQESRPTLPVVFLSRGNPACQTRVTYDFAHRFRSAFIKQRNKFQTPKTPLPPRLAPGHSRKPAANVLKPRSSELLKIGDPIDGPDPLSTLFLLAINWLSPMFQPLFSFKFDN